MDELFLASILFYDYKKVLAGDTSIRQEEVKLSLTVFLGIKNILAFWTTVLLVRAICNVKESLAKCGKLQINHWALRLNICLVFLS